MAPYRATRSFSMNSFLHSPIRSSLHVPRNLGANKLNGTVPLVIGDLTELTEILVAYDEEHLYVAGRFFDSDPSSIRVNSMYRDRLSDDDVFGILIDPFNDNDNGLWFFTTPVGVRGDVAISGDGQGSWNGSWNTYWDVTAVRTSEG